MLFLVSLITLLSSLLFLPSYLFVFIICLNQMTSSNNFIAVSYLFSIYGYGSVNSVHYSNLLP